VILGLKPYVTPCLSHVLGPSVIPSVSLGLKPYVTPCLSQVLRTFCDSGVEALCDSLFEPCPKGPSVIPFANLGLKPSAIV
jgi:hypothetical protein